MRSIIIGHPMATHKNKKGDWVDIRACETYVSYCSKFFKISNLIS